MEFQRVADWNKDCFSTLLILPLSRTSPFVRWCPMTHLRTPLFVATLVLFLVLTTPAYAVPVQWDVGSGGNGHIYDVVLVGSQVCHARISGPQRPRHHRRPRHLQHVGDRHFGGSARTQKRADPAGDLRRDHRATPAAPRSEHAGTATQESRPATPISETSRLTAQEAKTAPVPVCHMIKRGSLDA